MQTRLNKSQSGFEFRFWFCVILFTLCGCQAALDSLLPGVQDEALFAEAENRRERYQETREPADIRWLLKNQVKNGMSRAEVDATLGIEGHREFNDTPYLKEEGLYRSDDIVYRWGPDKEGNVYVLIFRDDHLINFENFSAEWDDSLMDLR